MSLSRAIRVSPEHYSALGLAIRSRSRTVTTPKQRRQPTEIGFSHILPPIAESLPHRNNRMASFDRAIDYPSSRLDISASRCFPPSGPARRALPYVD
ncbi:hypothetical protein PHSY_006130 [Pseudozyma hubeiensis SY62]|uniref:Uncharacterized protein n=1 Tax=Pseudozyma hubeiensis (strain SY62) TaxID=1305764 RepID=R9PAY2_PSEHS|nr:hypothetical protein PHSY_006130 [Pseudozyma hubeiensis SY62]GAC98536.1 hypothetical protein PHSY_006130 [Pseudozyma hubeiensis SY62]